MYFIIIYCNINHYFRNNLVYNIFYIKYLCIFFNFKFMFYETQNIVKYYPYGLCIMSKY